MKISNQKLFYTFWFHILYLRKIHKCCVCREAIRGRVITAMAKKFHPQCFVCTYCRKEFKERSFKTDPVENQPYCYGCFEKLLGHFGNAHINDVFNWSKDLRDSKDNGAGSKCLINENYVQKWSNWIIIYIMFSLPQIHYNTKIIGQNNLIR